jgi:hypothetical protein
VLVIGWVLTVGRHTVSRVILTMTHLLQCIEKSYFVSQC